MTTTRNSDLSAARRDKKDEFYTGYADIEKEVMAYVDYDPDVFRGKTILLPCDDPEWSNFSKFFAQKFTELGLAKVISTSYSKDGSPGRVFTLTAEDTNDDGRIDMDDIQWTWLEGNGDFRSEEVTALRNEADIIITNPPFSLFRPFLAWILEGDKQFLILGNTSAITYKVVFPLFKDDKLWFGPSITSGDREFRVPDDYPLDAAGWRMDEDGNKYLRVKGVRWFTNLDHGRRHEPLQLMTMADNLRYNRKLTGQTEYARYANFDAVEVGWTKAIPSDYDGLMGVPITFLDKYSPEQFEIIGCSLDLGMPMSTLAEKGTYQQGGPRFYVPNGDGTYRRLYDRLVIRHRKATQ